MDTAFRLNPFASVLETENEFMIHATGALQVRFAKKHKPFVERLTSGEPLPASELKRYVAPSRIREMHQKKILLAGDVPPLEGRYSRQLGFFSLITHDFEGVQARLQQADVLLLGAGGIGSHILWNLAAMGVKKITVVDFDVVDESNLNRQLMYTRDDVGKVKVHVLCEKIRAFNPEIEITAVNERIDSPADIEKHMTGKTLVVKAIDSPAQATEWVNAVCVKLGVPYISGGFVDYIGVVGPTYIPKKSVCAVCTGPVNLKRMSGTGATFAPLTTTVASKIAMFAFNIIVGSTDAIANKMYTYNPLTASWDSIPLAAQRACGVCGREPAPAAPAAANTEKYKVWAYRSAIALVMAIVATMRLAAGYQYVGVLGLTVLLLSLPVLELLFPGKPAEVRRQVFAVSFIYSAFGIAVAMIESSRTLFKVTGRGFDAFFSFFEQLGLAIVTTGIAAAFLFFVLISAMYGARAAMKTSKEWIG
jgi:molybdopterin/thiamine biosynthesis adenylyltransferase